MVIFAIPQMQITKNKFVHPMKKHKNITIFLAIISTVFVNLQPVLANSTEVQKTARNIKSVAQVKQYLREVMSPCEDGCSGYGLHIRAIRVCELVQALDIRVQGKISRKRSFSERNIPISKSDINLMRLILSQCKWVVRLPGDPADFVYYPNPKIKQQINKQLKIKL